MTGYAKKIDKNVTMSFRVNNKQLLKNYNKIWEKIEKLLNIDFESKPVYGDDDKYIKTKMKIYEKSIVIVMIKSIPREKGPCKCLSIIMINLVIIANKKYYSQTLLFQPHGDRLLLSERKSRLFQANSEGRFIQHSYFLHKRGCRTKKGDKGIFCWLYQANCLY